jgi:methyl-accepting chemotaxis protein
MEIIITVFGVLLALSIYANYNLVRKLEKIEEQLDDTIFDFKVKVRTALNRMRKIDYNGSFEADDEVGTIFKDLKRTIEDLDNTI